MCQRNQSAKSLQYQINQIKQMPSSHTNIQWEGADIPVPYFTHTHTHLRLGVDTDLMRSSPVSINLCKYSIWGIRLWLFLTNDKAKQKAARQTNFSHPKRTRRRRRRNSLKKDVPHLLIKIKMKPQEKKANGEMNWGGSHKGGNAEV